MPSITSTVRLSSGGDVTALINCWIDSILNAQNDSMVPKTFAASFRDHNPWHLPGSLHPHRKDWGTVRDIHNLLSFLRSPLVDLNFSIEDLVVRGDRVGYRLFCAGSVFALSRNGPPSMADQISNTHPAAELGPRVREGRTGADAPLSLDGEIHLVYERVGIYRVSQGTLIEHWGAFADASKNF